MIRHFRVHNYRCLENLDLTLSSHTTWLLIGNNGSGSRTTMYRFRKLATLSSHVAEPVNRYPE
jgi:predicted ATP-binding protein involved in virulence